jgi:hypothetical protein
MEKNTVIFNIYKINTENERVMDNSYSFNLNEKIIDIKNKILKDSFKNEYNYLDLENITLRTYKDYGKLFFDIGLLPSTIDNYKLSEFTNEGREFLFIGHAKNVLIEKKKLNNDSGIIKRIIKEDRKNSSNEFIYYDDEFPPLK